MASFIDKSGEQVEVALNDTLLKEAKAKKMTVRALINTKYETQASLPETFKQLCLSEGIYFGENAAEGLPSRSIGEIVAEGDNKLMAAGNTTELNPSRILLPPAILAQVESNLKENRKTPTDIFNSMLAMTTTVAGSKVEYPVIEYDTPGGPNQARSQRVAQLAKPAVMMNITASDVARKIPTLSLGATISDEAQMAASIDFLGLAISRQAEIERFANAGEGLLRMINGDKDSGTNGDIVSPLSTKTAASYDSSITKAGELTHLAWMKWLAEGSMYRTIDWVLVDSIETQIAIETRLGRPVVTTDVGKDGRTNTETILAYPAIGQNVKVFVAPAEWNFPAKTCVGLDSMYGMAKLINSNAEYTASVDFALQRSTGMRFDFGELYYRFFQEAWTVMTLTV